MKMKQTKEAQAPENQEACVSAGRLTDGSQRRKSSQSQKIISLYHHRQKKEEAAKAKDGREVNGSPGAKDSQGMNGSPGAKDSREVNRSSGAKDSRGAKGSPGTKELRGAKENLEMENDREHCVVCGRETEYARETPIAQRRGYIEGAGQLCRRCFAEIYAEEQHTYSETTDVKRVNHRHTDEN